MIRFYNSFGEYSHPKTLGGCKGKHNKYFFFLIEIMKCFFAYLLKSLIKKLTNLYQYHRCIIEFFHLF